MSSTMEKLTDTQIAELRDLIAQNGYLPYSPKALRLLDEAERLFSRAQKYNPGNVAQFREQMNEKGYLPSSKAHALVDEVERLRDLIS